MCPWAPWLPFSNAYSWKNSNIFVHRTEFENIEDAQCMKLMHHFHGREIDNLTHWTQGVGTVILNWYYSNSYQGYMSWTFPMKFLCGGCWIIRWWLVEFGAGNGLLPSGNKPLPEPILAQIYVTIWHHYNELMSVCTFPYVKIFDTGYSLLWHFRKYSYCQKLTLLHFHYYHFSLAFGCSPFMYSVNAPSQWEMALHCNAISHWLGAFTDWSLKIWHLGKQETIFYYSKTHTGLWFLNLFWLSQMRIAQSYQISLQIPSHNLCHVLTSQMLYFLNFSGGVTWIF